MFCICFMSIDYFNIILNKQEYANKIDKNKPFMGLNGFLTGMFFSLSGRLLNQRHLFGKFPDFYGIE